MAAAALMIVPAGGCAEQPGAADGERPLDNTGGGPLPQQFAAETYPGDRREVRVQVRLAANGCFMGLLDGEPGDRSHLVVWPSGAEGAGDRVRLPDGATVEDGDLVVGQGLLMPAGNLEGIDSGGFWNHIVTFCDEGAERVLVLDSARSG